MKNNLNAYLARCSAIIDDDPPLQAQDSCVAIGAKVTCRVFFDRGNGAWKEGTVTYIHPKKYFYRVRFDFPSGSFTQAYQWGFAE